ncbi:hypothetical protein [uncultured Paraglaciecola sp.]|uniref:hypothetical protein n=1 Tax=uncultured Paraglaciecola sp. TaxID=1765024 RepID=UPI002631C535|nr:hypothetical protein [uncultured Paraglaciecola sp.]
MLKNIRGIIVVLALIGWGGAANATLIFDFSFKNVSNGGGLVTGEILGLSDNVTGMATSFRILSNTSGFGIGEYIETQPAGLFTVASGVLTGASFFSFAASNSNGASMGLRLNPNGRGWVGLTNGTDNILRRLTTTGFTVTQRVSIPAPSTLVIFTLALVGLGLARREKA